MQSPGAERRSSSSDRKGTDRDTIRPPEMDLFTPATSLPNTQQLYTMEIAFAQLPFFFRRVGSNRLFPTFDPH